MKKLLSSVLSVCLLVNAWLPYAWGQTVPTVKAPDLHKVLQGSAAQRIAKRQARIAQLQQLISQEKDSAKLTAYLQEMDRLRAANEMDRQVDEQMNGKQVHPADNTRVQKPVEFVRTDTSWDAFLAKKRTNTLKFEDLIEYANPVADPANPTAAPKEDFQVITQAAEMIGNNLDPLTPENCDEEVFAFINGALQTIQVRLLYQLYKMENYRLSGYENMMRTLAVSTVRITLLKIKQFYDRMGQPNPVRFAAASDGEFKVQGGKTNAAMSGHQNPAIRYEETPQSTAVRKDHNVSVRPEDLKEPSSNSFGLADGKNQSVNPYEDAFEMFISELKEYAGKELDPSDWDYQTLSTLAEGATLYTLLYDPKRLPEIVRIFDTGAETDGDFSRLYSPILNAIFINVFETVRFSDFSSQKSQQVLELLLAFSDPNRYSIPTQIFALEAASLMFRPFNDQYRDQVQNAASGYTPFAVNFFKPKEDYRPIFADRTAHLYCPLTGRSSPEYDYGLDSEQMAQLADKLAFIYDGFYDILSLTVSSPTSAAHPHPRTPCDIVGRPENNLNHYKQKQERDMDTLLFMGETIFWVYGFEIFRVIGTVYRMTRGAVAVMPRALSVARAAQPGTRMASFANTVRKGAQGSNLIERSAKHGFQYFEQVAADSKEATSVIEVNGTKIGLKPISSPHTRQLVQGKWNYYKGGPVRDAVKPMKPKNIYVRDGEGRLFKMDVTRDLMTPVSEEVASATAMTEYQPFTLGSKYDLFGEATHLTPVGHSEMPVLLSASDARLARIGDRWAGWFSGTMEPYQRLENGLFWARSWGRPPVPFAQSSQVVMAPKSLARAVNSRWAGWFGKSESFEPVSLNALMDAGGFTTDLKALQSGSWARQALSTYFTEVDYHSTFANYMLPRYFLNKKGMELLLKNPSLAPSMLNFAAWHITEQAVVFGGLGLVDKMAFGPYMYYLLSISKDNMEELKQTRGDTFSEEQMEQDRLYRQKQLEDLNSILHDPRANWQMDTYRRVLLAFRPIFWGASTELIKLGIQDMISHLLDDRSTYLLSAADMKGFVLSAYNIENNRATRDQQQVAQEQAEQAQAQAKAQLAKEMKEYMYAWEQQLYDSDLKVAWLILFEPNLKNKIHQACEDYIQESLALQETAMRENLTQEEYLNRQNKLRLQLDSSISEHIANTEEILSEKTKITQEEWDKDCTEEAASFKEWIAQMPGMKESPQLLARAEKLVDDYIEVKKDSYSLSYDKQSEVIGKSYNVFSKAIDEILEEASKNAPQEDTSNPQAQPPQDVY